MGEGGVREGAVCGCLVAECVVRRCGSLSF